MVEVKAYTPYIYQLKTVKSTILYYGTEHTFDVHSDVFRDVQDIISSYQPNLVLVEGVLQLKNNNQTEKTAHILWIRSDLPGCHNFCMNWKKKQKILRSHLLWQNVNNNIWSAYNKSETGYFVGINI